MKSRTKQIVDIIIDIKLKRVTEDDRQILLDWLRESGENTQLYRKIIRGESIKERYLAERDLNSNLDYEAIYKQLFNTIIVIKRRRMLKIFSATTAIAACLIFSMVMVFNENGSTTNHIANKKITKVTPQKLFDSSVKLTIGNGEVIYLTNDVEIKLNSAKIEASKISYENTILPTEKIEIHQIEIGKGEQYQLILSDGTKVWLNSDTKLQYPTKFVDNNRLVKLVGEAYFEVATDNSKPFIVESNGQKVTVLGTSFNINAHQTDTIIKTTLISGKVSVKNEKTGNEITLNPGMQTQLNTKTGSIIVKKEINTDNIKSWIDGIYTFVNEDLSIILQTISRWYSVECVVNCDINNHTFNGSIKRGEDLKSILNAFTIVGGPRFKIVDNIIYISDVK